MNITEIVESIGDNDEDRAKKLGVSVRTIYRYKNGQMPSLQVLMRNTELAKLLLSDKESVCVEKAA